MARQPSFFDAQEVGPRLRPRPVAAPPPVAPPLAESERPANWRAPTIGEEACVRCQGAACFGHHHSWYCYDCRPAGFLPKDRNEGPSFVAAEKRPQGGLSGGAVTRVVTDGLDTGGAS